ncbi:MAG TPA: hypothetical protein VFM63_02930 [Pyrinomonadaceae bacterium]|nr:hypothetical protein [Pyrinomonadaceae bacterium]
MKIYLAIAMTVFVFAGCSGNPDAEHTTATTIVPPPPRQVLRDERAPGKRIPVKLDKLQGKFDPTKPLLFLYFPGNETVEINEEVRIIFSLTNVKLRGDGGEYRVRYMVDDDDMQWIDRWEDVVLTGWLPGNHTIRVELIGPDGWPYKNGDYNVITREITIVK